MVKNTPEIKLLIFKYLSDLLQFFNKHYKRNNVLTVTYIPENKEYTLEEINKWLKENE